MSTQAERRSPGPADWFPLDNAAKIYPASYSDAAPAVFRVMLTFREPVRYEAMERALTRMAARTPYYQVHLRRGLFWYFLERHERPPRLHLLPDTPISPIALKRPEEALYRVQIRDSRLAIDFSHVLTDGYGAIRTLLSLGAEYLRQCGVPVPKDPSLLDPDDEPGAEEFEDAYSRYYTKGLPPPDPLTPAYHLPGLRSWHRYRIIRGRLSVREVRDMTRRYGVSMTEFLCAAYMHALAGIHREQAGRYRQVGSRVIRVEVPVNLRRLHETGTMRNFSLFVMPEIDLRLGQYSFEEILGLVHHQMRSQLTEKQLARQLARNVAGERNAVVRLVPRIFKDLYLAHLHRRFGDNLYSGVLSNLGPAGMPQELAAELRGVDFVLGPNPILKKNLAVLSYGDELTLNFGSVIGRTELERRVFRLLASLGLTVRVGEGLI